MADYLVTESGISILDIPNEPDFLLSSDALDELKNDDQSRISFLQSFEKDSVIVKCIGHPISKDRFKKINSTYHVR